MIIEMPQKTPTIDRNKDIVIPLIIRGQIIETDLLSFSTRQGGDGFSSPEVAKHFDKLPTTARSLKELYSIGLDEIIELLAEVGGALDIRYNRHMRIAFEMSARAAGLPRPILESAYQNLPTMFDRDRISRFIETQIGRDYLEGWVKQDLGSGRSMSVRAFGARAVHIIAGNTPAVAFLTVLRAAITRSDAIIKLPSNDPMSAIAILRTMIEIAPDHPVTRHMSAAYWKGGDDKIESRLYHPRNIEKIIAWGGFASVKHIAKYLQPGIDLITLDPKHSGSIIGSEALVDEETIVEVARRAAIDIGAFNQEACANARVIYVICDKDDPGQMDKLNMLGKRILAGLKQLPEEISTPAKTVNPLLQDELLGIEFQGDFYKLIKTANAADGAVIVSQIDEPVEFSDLLCNRTANLVPVANVDDALKRINSASQTIGVYPDSLKDEIRDVLAIQGAQHIVSLGEVLAMGVAGPQDGLETERRMLRWIRDMNGERMENKLEFGVRSQTPGMDHYRRDWRPGSNLGIAGMWLGAVVSDPSGQFYFGMRGIDDFVPGMVRPILPVCGFRKLIKDMKGNPPHLFSEYSGIDWFEPYECTETANRSLIIYESGRVERDKDGCHWYDAQGRWELHAKTVSDVFIVHVPKQEGVDFDVYYRHELAKVVGQIEGVSVEGYCHQDYAYAPEGMVYAETAIPRKLQGMWVSWLHEFADGELGGGCLWQGRSGVNFGPGYQVKNGVTSVHKDVVAKPVYNDENKLCGLNVTIGGDSYQFELDTMGSPIHYFGPLVGTSLGKKPVKSWCWIEYTGNMLTGERLDQMLKRYHLARGEKYRGV